MGRLPSPSRDLPSSLRFFSSPQDSASSCSGREPSRHHHLQPLSPPSNAITSFSSPSLLLPPHQLPLFLRLLLTLLLLPVAATSVKQPPRMRQTATITSLHCPFLSCFFAQLHQSQVGPINWWGCCLSRHFSSCPSCYQKSILPLTPSDSSMVLMQCVER